MSQPLEQPEGDARLDENLSRLLQLEPRSPQLPPEAEARMLAALVARQAELFPMPAKHEEPTVSLAHAAATSSAGSPSRGSRFALAAALGLALAGVIVGAMLWNQPSPAPGNLQGQASAPPSVRFATGEVLRTRLDDGTIVIAQSGTKFIVAGPRRIKLEHGDLYLIVAKTGKPFTVVTASGDAIATGTRFALSAGKSTTAAVAQGHVTLSGSAGSVKLSAGEQGELAQGKKPTRRAAPRLSYLVSWAKEALAQEELLVAKNESENGLIALDPWGQQTRLSLRKYHVDVYIEDGIARTTIDQTFFNHNPWNSEGTFYFPLPPDASVSRLAMYVAGQLNEGGMVERGRGQQIYNDILHQRRDPALLEMMEGNVFKMRIFPLEGRQEKRIFLSYTQNLEELYGTLRYWFPMDHTHSLAKDLSIRVQIKNGAKLYDPQSSTHKLTSAVEENDLVLTYSAQKVKPDLDLLLHLVPSAAPEATRVATCEKDGQRFVFARFSPEIPGAVEPRPRQWIVVNDVSASRSKIDLAAQRYILERLNAEADDGDSLYFIQLNVKAKSISESFVPVRSKEAGALIARAAASPRLGATNLVAGMEAAAQVIRDHKPTNPHILYLGDGVATDGSTEAFEPARAVPREATFVGIGVGKKVYSLFLQEAANRTGGMFTTINPDEDIDWRVFDLISALNTPRLLKIDVELQNAAGKPLSKSIAYPSALALAHGETLSVVARCEAELPAKIVLTGKVGDTAYRSVADVAAVPAAAEYIPRVWAKRHINELLKSDMGREQEIIGLSQQYYVVTPFTSLIVLENDAMYEQYKVERGRKDHWATYPAPAKIPVVSEPVDWSRWGWYGGPIGEDQKIEATANPQTVREIVDSVQLRIDAPFYYWRQREEGQSRYAFYSMLDSDARPAKSLTLMLLLAAGEQRMAMNFFGTRTGSPPSAQIPPSQTTPAEAEPPISLNYVVGDLELPALIGFDTSGIKLQQLSLLSDSRLVGMNEYFAGPPLSGEALPFAIIDGTSVVSGKLLSAPLLLPVQSTATTAPTSLVLSKYGKRWPLAMVDDAALGDSLGGRGVQPALLRSLERELSQRWERIDRDIRQFNRQYGYWNDWTWSTHDSLDLRQSQSGRWYGGLDEVLESFESLERGEAYRGFYQFETATPSLLEGQWPVAESFRRMRLPQLDVIVSQGGSSGGGAPAPMPVSLAHVLTTSFKAVPGTNSVLAADWLATRRAELAGKRLSADDEREAQAIDFALEHLGAAAARLEDTSPFWGGSGWGYRPQMWTFEPPTIQVYQDYNWSFDLTRYTPALQSNSFDILCEVVAQYQRKPEGQIEERAATAIADARRAISAAAIRYETDGPELLVASGDRYSLTHRTDMYLEQRMACDGEQIVHQYEELGLAARRPATALRLSALRQLTPHLLAPADALQARYDIALADANDDDFALKLTPIGQKADAEEPLALVIRAARDGRILEKQATAGGKLRVKLTFSYAGDEIMARWSDADGKELAKATYFAEPLADEAQFACDLADYVVIDMPLRKPSYYGPKIVAEEQFASLSGEERAEQIRLRRQRTLSLIQELQWRRWGGQNGEAQQSMTQVLALHKLGEAKIPIGDLTLLGSSGAHQSVTLAKQYGALDETHPAARYYNLRWRWVEANKELADHQGGLVGHLGAFQACAWRQDAEKDFEFFAEKYPDSPLLLAATNFAAQWGQKPGAWKALYDNPRWQLLAMMMAAPHLQQVEDRHALAAAYLKMHEQFTKEKLDTPITAAIVPILRGHADGDTWRKVRSAKFDAAVAADSTAALLHFAEQAMTWGEADDAEKALRLARERLAKHDKLGGKLALAQTYWVGSRQKEALALYDQIFATLETEKISPTPGLLSAAARLAQQAGDLGRAIDLEEQALAAEHPYLPEMINLQAFRQRYHWLWQQYQSKVSEAAAAKNDAEAIKWLARAKTTWGEWRKVDADNSELSLLMATLQATAGRDADAWLYLSTIVDMKPRDAASYGALSNWYRGRGDTEAAQAWLARAYKWDTANPQWLFERAQLLEQLDRHVEARKLYEQIVDGQWASGLQGYVEQAKQKL